MGEWENGRMGDTSPILPFSLSEHRPEQQGTAMLRILGSPQRLCDGATRRDLLTAGAISLFGGMSLPAVARAEEAAREERGQRKEQAARSGWLRPGKAKSVILLYLMGGPPHQDM